MARLTIVAVATILVTIGCMPSPPVPVSSPTPAPTAETGDLQLAALERVVAESAMPVEFEFVNGFPRQVLVSVPAVGDGPVDRAMRYVIGNRDLYGLDGADIGLGVRRVSAPAGAPFQVVALYQTYRGVPIHGAALNVSIFGDRIMGSTGRLLTDLRVETVPAITAADAEARAGAPADGLESASPGVTSLVIHDPSLASEAAPHPRLAWRVHVAEGKARWVFVDAADGSILAEEPITVDAYRLELNDAESEASAGDSQCYYWSDETVIGDEDEFDGEYVNDEDAVDAWTFARQTYQFYREPPFKRDSYDGEGALLEIYIHTNVIPGNASWNAGCDTIEFSDDFVADDIMTHEFTHAVNTYGAELAVWNASGALNESMADTFAFLHTGKTLVGADAPGGPVRNFADPAAVGFGDPDRWSERRPLPGEACLVSPGSPACLATFDQGYVHSNNGIPNRAAFLLAQGGTHADTNVTVQGIGNARMRYLYYLALTIFLPAGGDVWDLRKELLTLAEILDYLDSEKCAIKNAFGAVEVGSPDNDCDGGLDTTNDPDGDFIKDPADNCPAAKNPGQANIDGDALGDACDGDDDGDGIPEVPGPGQLIGDNCPGVSNADQADADFDRIGTACDYTEDGDLDDDGVSDVHDNCPLDYNPRAIVPGGPGQIELGELAQPDSDGDGEGDACDPDLDQDGIGNNGDNCIGTANPDQADSDGDGLGNACDACPTTADSGISWSSKVIHKIDGDVIISIPVSKPDVPDADADGIPDACDPGGFGISATVEIDGEPWDLGLMPRPDDPARHVTVAGLPGGSIDLPLPICDLFCEADPPANVCQALGFDGLSDDVIAVVIDDRGFAVGRARGAERRDLRFASQGGRNYRLRLILGPDFSGRAEIDLTHVRCTIGDRDPQPFLGPPPVGPGPGPTPSPGPTPTPTQQGVVPRATVTFQGVDHEIRGGECTIGEIDGVRYLSISIGTPGGDADYLGLVVVEGDAIYRGEAVDIPPNGSVGGIEYVLRRSSVVVEIGEGMSVGRFEGTNGVLLTPGDVSGTFSCPGGPTAPR